MKLIPLAFALGALTFMGASAQAQTSGPVMQDHGGNYSAGATSQNEVSPTQVPSPAKSGSQMQNRVPSGTYSTGPIGGEVKPTQPITREPGTQGEVGPTEPNYGADSRTEMGASPTQIPRTESEPKGKPMKQEK